MEYIKFFDELRIEDISLAGGKAAGLGEMVKAGLPVPSGFCLTTMAYRDFVQANDLQEKILSHAAQKERSEHEIRQIFSDAFIQDSILNELKEAYQLLDLKAVAIRSSATAEDLPEASFAGQQDTYLNIQGIENIKIAIKNCWASLWTNRAIHYRKREKISSDEISMAVVVQELVMAESAGILFTANPVTGKRKETVINAAWGLGEAIVSGLVTPDTIIIDTTNGQIKSEEIADKKQMTVRTAKGSAEQDVPESQRMAKVLSKSQIERLVDLGRTVESHSKQPMDLEWAIANDQLFLLQARPITALPPELEEVDLMGMEWSREMLIERYPDPITPFTWSAVSDTLFSAFEQSIGMMGGTLPKNAPPMIRKIYGRPYINVTLLNQGFESSPARPPVKKDGEEESAPRPRPSLKELPKLLTTFIRLGNLLRTNHRQWDRLQTPFETEMKRLSKNDWKTFSTAELKSQLLQQEALLAPLLEIHAHSIMAAEISLQLLQSITRSWLKDKSQLLATTMLSGLTGNMTIKTNRALWSLAVQARSHNGLRKILTNPLKQNWREQMEELPDTNDFLSGLDDFLEKYGHRSPLYELMNPTWVEKPEQILDMVRVYLDSSISDPGEGEVRQAAAREIAVSQAQQDLPFFKRFIFNRVLPLTQTYFRLRENQQFYLMLILPNMRRILAVLGRRLKETGRLLEADDIYFLNGKEQKALAAQLAGLPIDQTNLPSDPLKLVRERQSELTRHQKMQVPMVLGGKNLKIKKMVSTDNLNGVAASSGRVKGSACIVLGPEDFSKLQPGQILVTPATTPAWTPLFGIAAGLITDHGGLLSHSGVVAREYGLPAVLGTNDATQRIKDGDQITVDGDQGMVIL